MMPRNNARAGAIIARPRDPRRRLAICWFNRKGAPVIETWPIRALMHRWESARLGREGEFMVEM